jgi:putative transposase
MAAGPSIDVSGWLEEQLAQASPDLLRAMVATFAEALMSAEAGAVCGAGYDERSQEYSQRLPAPGVGYPGGQHQPGDPEAAAGLVFPGLAAGAAPPRRGRPGHGGGHVLPAEGVHPADGETGRDARDYPVEQVAGQRDGQGPGHAQVEAFRTRPLDAGAYTFVAADALVLKVREAGRIVNVHALLAAGVNADGYREILGLHVTSAEAIGATLPGAAWQRCRTTPPTS